MEQITFNQLHLAAIDFVNTENIIYHNQLKVIGKWYHLYLNNNDVDKIYLNVPYFSDDFKVITFCKPSNKITNLLGVENDEFFLNEIDFSLNTLIKLFNRSSLKLF